MKRTLRTLAIMALALGCVAAQAADTEEMVTDAVKKLAKTLDTVPADISTVAVYNIEPDSKGEVNIPALQDQISQELLDSGRFKVIDRKSLSALLEEQKLSMTGAVDTRAMVKAGKVIGVQGFFLGSVVSQADKVILNLKLIDVQTSATIFAKKFVGESRSGAQIGIGWGYATTSPFGVVLHSWRGAAPDTLALDSLSGVKRSSIMNWTLSYRQSLQALRYALLGVDLNVVSFDSAKGELRVTESGMILTSTGQAYSFGDNTNTAVRIISLKPKIYLSSKHAFGWAHDWLNPFVGVSVSMIVFSCDIGGWGRLDADPPSESYEEKSSGANLLVVAPVFGTDLNLTKSLSIVVEATYLASESAPPADSISAYIAKDHNVTLSPYLEKGLMLNIGMKYSISIF